MVWAGLPRKFRRTEQMDEFEIPDPGFFKEDEVTPPEEEENPFYEPAPGEETWGRIRKEDAMLEVIILLILVWIIS
jgi:hypothetical protein